VTSATSLFNSPTADITLDQVRELISQNLPESLTLEYKETYSPGLVASVAAMANSYGGLILVGVTDQAQQQTPAGTLQETRTITCRLTGGLFRRERSAAANDRRPA
jgi:predicted HTH transcriptional regulator